MKQDYLKQNSLIQTMRSLEVESGMILDEYGRELQFLRSLLLDGQWKDIELFMEPICERGVSKSLCFAFVFCLCVSY